MSLSTGTNKHKTCLTPWTGSGALRSCKVTAWAPEPVSSFGHIGVGWHWLQGQAGITGRRLRELEEWCKAMHSPPTHLLWWWMRWWGTGVRIWWRARKRGASVDKRVVIIMTCSTWTMTWLYFQTHNGSRVHLVPW